MNENNFEKYNIYRQMKSDLAKAMNSGFYYQAIFIEYAILEDRCSSVLRHAGVNCLDRKGNEIGLQAKLNKIKDNPAFQDKNIRRRLTPGLVDSAIEWKDRRNSLVHALAKIPYDAEAVKEVAESGRELIKLFDNKVSSVNNYLDKAK